MWRRTVVSTIFAINGLQGIAAAQAPIIMISNVISRNVVSRAVNGAIRRLEGSNCQLLLDEFTDATGTTLRGVLDRAELTPIQFLARLRFADGNETRQCQKAEGIAAYTVPGNRVIFVCSSMFALEFRDEMKAAEMIIIHEMLHAAGLGENPPTSRDITARVTKRCGA
jgi:hypothetical protein